jgi:hypothetical protein
MAPRIGLQKQGALPLTAIRAARSHQISCNNIELVIRLARIVIPSPRAIPVNKQESVSSRLYVRHCRGAHRVVCLRVCDTAGRVFSLHMQARDTSTHSHRCQKAAAPGRTWQKGGAPYHLLKTQSAKRRRHRSSGGSFMSPTGSVRALPAAAVIQPAAGGWRSGRKRPRDSQRAIANARYAFPSMIECKLVHARCRTRPAAGARLRVTRARGSHLHDGRARAGPPAVRA